MERENKLNDSYIKNTYDLSFKIVLLGESGVGKSSIMLIFLFEILNSLFFLFSYRYVKDEFHETHQPTLGSI